MSLGMLVLLVLLVLVLCVVGALLLGILRVRVDARVHCSICGREIPWDRYRRTVLFRQFLRGRDIGLITPCEYCAEGYPVLGERHSSAGR
jgi:hypothetical protein